jgi:hypothetical protein
MPEGGLVAGRLVSHSGPLRDSCADASSEPDSGADRTEPRGRAGTCVAIERATHSPEYVGTGDSSPLRLKLSIASASSRSRRCDANVEAQVEDKGKPDRGDLTPTGNCPRTRRQDY